MPCACHVCNGELKGWDYLSPFIPEAWSQLKQWSTREAVEYICAQHILKNSYCTDMHNHLKEEKKCYILAVLISGGGVYWNKDYKTDSPKSTTNLGYLSNSAVSQKGMY